MPLGQQADEHPLHQLVLADDNPLDLEDGPLQRVHLGGQPLGTTGGASWAGEAECPPGVW